MEIFIIVVAVIAVAAALILLVLLQLRIKKQATAENSTPESQNTSTQASSVEEIALDYPNDLILKTGPPPYRQVMKSPELYPLASSTHIEYGRGDVKIQIPTSPIHHERTKRTWNELLNAVIRPDDYGLDTPPGKQTIRGENNGIQKESHILNLPPVDEVLPTYDEVVPTCDEVRSGIPAKESRVEYCQKTFPRRDSVDILKSGYHKILGFNFGVEQTMLCRNECVFTISNALQAVITEEIMHSQSRPRLATL
ncbi:uncharacterized protein LOC114522856 isoform X2 [Dendronephthya gigantea]|nr:uncharacterized protein LOC114522856 isoform X2 [Dendronephthya gigantea]